MAEMFDEIYLDNAATTEVDPIVAAAMAEWTNYANAGSIHKVGIEARAKIDEARERVAQLLNCETNKVIFTSGGSESNATVMRGYLHTRRRVIMFSETEHESVRKNAHVEWLMSRYVHPPIEIPVNLKGVVDIDQLDRQISKVNKSGSSNANGVKLVSVMAVNNEIGTVNPVKEIAQVCHEHGVAFHSDFVQAVGSVSTDMKDYDCDYASFSAHKFHGPKGVGVLYCKNPKSIMPLIAGSESQEFGVRGGTENVAGIIGLGEAARLVYEGKSDIKMLTSIKLSFYERIMHNLKEHKLENIVHYNGLSPESDGKILSLTIDGVDAQTLVLAMSARGVYISAGSACNAHSTVGSDVLRAIGLTDGQAHNTVRISFSKYNTTLESLRAADIMAETICNLLSMFRG